MGDKSKLPPGALSFSLSNTPEQNRAALEAQNKLRVQDIIRGAEKDPSYLALQTYLQSRNAVPEVKVGYADGNKAVFKTNSLLGGDLPKNGQIEIGYNYAQPGPTATGRLTHETTHAADEAMSRQFNGRVQDMGGSWRNIPWNVNQFADAYRKMNLDPNNLKENPRQDLAAQFYPEWLKEQAKYRANRMELPAHALGNFAEGYADNPAPPHVDASAATDFMVLLELAQRDSGKTQGPAPGVLDRLKNLFK